MYNRQSLKVASPQRVFEALWVGYKTTESCSEIMRSHW